MKTILFVDDDPMLIRGLRRALQHRADDWDMIFVSSGTEALNALAAGPIDAIITDMRMPGMNGAELLLQVWKNYPSTARIVLSGQADQELVMQCAMTAHQYLSKPCDSGKIEACIDRVVSLQSHEHGEAVCRLMGSITNLPSCPELFNKINQALSSDSCDLETISALIEQDAAITAKLLKLVNSAFFGVGREIGSAMEAVNYLGTSQLKTIILASQVFDHSSQHANAGLNMPHLWRRALLTGQCAKALAMASAPTRPLKDEAFTAGVLHSCGLLILAESQPNLLKEAISAARVAHSPLPTHELFSIGATDAEVGGYLLGLWSLPMPIVDAVLYYPTGPPPQDAVAPLSLLIHAAHALLGEHMPLIEGVPADPLNVALLEAHGWGLLVPEWRECVANILTQKD